MHEQKKAEADEACILLVSISIVMSIFIQIAPL